MSARSTDLAFQRSLNDALLNELSLIKDLKLGEKGYGYWLDVVAVEVKSANNISIGYALSVSITSTRYCRPLVETSDKNELETYDDLIFHNVIIINKGGLSVGAKNIVMVFNATIDPFRKTLKNLDVNKIKK